MDIDTFVTQVYVLVDDWCKSQNRDAASARLGAPRKMDDSEVLTVAIVGQWRAGTCWDSERGVVRWMDTYGRGYFPHMLKRSAFNQRVKQLWGRLVQLQQDLAARIQVLQPAKYELVDCVPVPAYSNGQALREKSHALADSDKGKGGTQGGFYDRLANIQDRWLMEALLAARHGTVRVSGPPPDLQTAKANRPVTPPQSKFSPPDTAGRTRPRAYIADKGFNGQRWLDHWQHTAQARVIAVPPANSHLYKSRWPKRRRRALASIRQVVETVFSALCQMAALKRLRARSPLGRLTRLALALTTFNLGLYLNYCSHRRPFTLLTLIL